MRWRPTGCASPIGEPFTLLADAYYACGHLAQRLLLRGCHLLSRARRNAVAYLPPPAILGKRGRGRPRVFGEKVKLWTLFDCQGQDWQTADSPVYGERGVQIRFVRRELLWRPLGQLVHYVLVDHPTRGRLILITTDLALAPIEVIRLYGLRFKIELSFKQALRVLGVYAYHFWMRSMDKIKRTEGTQHLHHKSQTYRDAVRRKLGAYHCHIQLGLIAQGLLQYLAVTYPQLVWNCFGSWLRTVRPGIPPSEFVTSIALANSLPQFLAHRQSESLFKKFLCENLDPGRSQAWRLTG